MKILIIWTIIWTIIRIITKIKVIITMIINKINKNFLTVGANHLPRGPPTRVEPEAPRRTLGGGSLHSTNWATAGSTIQVAALSQPPLLKPQSPCSHRPCSPYRLATFSGISRKRTVVFFLYRTTQTNVFMAFLLFKRFPLCFVTTNVPTSFV